MDKKTYDEGLAVRRAVLGAEYVDNSVRVAKEVFAEVDGKK